MVVAKIQSMPSYANDHIAAILRSMRTIAIVGASSKPVRPSWFVAKYLQEKGYRVIPVNPGLAGQTLFGEKVYANVKDLDLPVDMIDIFRASEATGAIVEEAVAVKQRLGLKVIWMQLGIVNEEAARRAEAAGLEVVMDRCPKIEYGRLCGDIGFMGVNRRLIDNRKKPLGFGRENLSRNAIGRGKGKL